MVSLQNEACIVIYNLISLQSDGPERHFRGPKTLRFNTGPIATHFMQEMLTPILLPLCLFEISARLILLRFSGVTGHLADVTRLHRRTRVHGARPGPGPAHMSTAQAACLARLARRGNSWPPGRKDMSGCFQKGNPAAFLL